MSSFSDKIDYAGQTHTKQYIFWSSNQDDFLGPSPSTRFLSRPKSTRFCSFSFIPLLHSPRKRNVVIKTRQRWLTQSHSCSFSFDLCPKIVLSRKKTRILSLILVSAFSSHRDYVILEKFPGKSRNRKIIRLWLHCHRCGDRPNSRF